jgi:hypothetical protein
VIEAVLPPTSEAARDHVRIRIDGLDIGVRSDLPAVLDTVATSYRAFLVEAATPTSAGDRIVWIDTPSSGDDEIGAILGTLDRIVDAVIDGLGAEGIVGTHAASVVVDGRAVVLAGPSGAGKSTLTLAMLRDGASLLTDELTLIAPDDRTVLPYPRALHVSPTTVELLPELGFLESRPRQDLGAGSEWSVTVDDLERAFGTGVAAPSPLAAIVLLDDRGDQADEPAIESIGGAAATMTLLRGTPAAARDFGATMARLGAIAGGVPAFRLRATDVARTAAALRAQVATIP